MPFTVPLAPTAVAEVGDAGKQADDANDNGLDEHLLPSVYVPAELFCPCELSPLTTRARHVASAAVDGRRTNQKRLARLEATPYSGLLFQGHLAVHGLFIALCNLRRESERRLPELLSPAPFQNAAIRSLQVWRLGKNVGHSEF